MKGLFIWANSYCRSTLGFYRGLGKSFDCPVKIVVLKGLSEARKKTGFVSDEFSGMDISFYQGLQFADRQFKEYKDYKHIFGSYQSDDSISLIKLAISNGVQYGVCSEAPCNMSSGLARLLKEIYIHTILPYKVREVVEHSDFIVNFSGDNQTLLLSNGWTANKIIPCGYYSPRIDGTHNRLRTEDNWNNFSILLSGIHQWHRSPMLFLEAINLLKLQGLTPLCNITQEGPLFNEMKKYAIKHHLDNVQFLGFVSIDMLKRLYETCSVYVGAGNYEPWGMRLNDALQCGAPLIVNRGMGGVKLVDDYQCGLAFGRGNAEELAQSIKRLMTDENLYLDIAKNAYLAADQISPENKSEFIAFTISKKFHQWK